MQLIVTEKALLAETIFRSYLGNFKNCWKFMEIPTNQIVSKSMIEHLNIGRKSVQKDHHYPSSSHNCYIMGQQMAHVQV